MPIVLGVDPGSRFTGYGLIEVQWQPFRFRYLDSGCIRLKMTGFPQRLAEIFSALTDLIKVYQPEQMAIEDVFVADNPRSALKLGQARGAAIVAAATAGLAVFEYSSRQIKQAVVGYGAAEKHQVQDMIRSLLALTFLPGKDEADGLATAWCHAHMHRSVQLMERLP